MAGFERVDYDAQNIVTKDELSIPGVIANGGGVIPAGGIVVYDKKIAKWIKYVEATHGTGLYPLGIIKVEVDASTEDVPVAILKRGIINAKEITILTAEQVSLLMIQGIILL